MTPAAVLQQYLDLCGNDISRLIYQLASNAVLEWNGVTIRGGSKIVKFLRQKQLTGMVHSFSGACAVEAFEDRATHIATKTIPPENLIQLSNSNREEHPASTELSSPSTSTSDIVSRVDLSYETPPRTLPAAPHPPPLTGGRQFLPLSSDEDDDDEHDDSSSNKRTKSSSPADESRSNAYSDLHYLEAIGMLRTANEPKHRGTRTTHHIPREDSSADSSGGSSATHTPRRSGDFSEKRTKLKASYRTHLQTGEVQFALIIYEHISTRSTTVRRNLFCEELHAPADSEEETPSPTRRRLTSSPQPTPLPVTPPTPEALAQESPPRTPVQPPGTPVKRRRIPPLIAGMRSSPRRSRPIDFAIALEGSSSTSSASSSSFMHNFQQTWPRKNTSVADNPGGSTAKSRKLSTSSSTIRKPLRF